MSYFRPIEMNMDEEQLDRFRKEKLKCEALPAPPWVWGCWEGAALTLPSPPVPASPVPHVRLGPRREDHAAGVQKCNVGSLLPCPPSCQGCC